MTDAATEVRIQRIIDDAALHIVRDRHGNLDSTDFSLKVLSGLKMLNMTGYVSDYTFEITRIKMGLIEGDVYATPSSGNGIWIPFALGLPLHNLVDIYNQSDFDRAMKGV